MREEGYKNIICEKFCNYYKPKEAYQYCEGFSFLRRNLTSNELRDLVTVFRLHESPYNEIMDTSICSPCEFKVDGCDFYMKQSNIPCGGFLIINRILSLF